MVWKFWCFTSWWNEFSSFTSWWNGTTVNIVSCFNNLLVLYMDNVVYICSEGAAQILRGFRSQKLLLGAEKNIQVLHSTSLIRSILVYKRQNSALSLGSVWNIKIIMLSKSHKLTLTWISWFTKARVFFLFTLGLYFKSRNFKYGDTGLQSQYYF